MRKLISVAAALAIGALIAVSITKADEKEEEKDKKPMSVHDIMEKGFKGSKALYRKIISTKKEPTKEEKEEFLSMMKDMAKNKPPKGDEEAWKEKTKALVEPTEKIVKGEDVKEAIKELKKAASCAKCHKEHKPDKDE